MTIAKKVEEFVGLDKIILYKVKIRSHYGKGLHDYSTVYVDSKGLSYLNKKRECYSHEDDLSSDIYECEEIPLKSFLEASLREVEEEAKRGVEERKVANEEAMASLVSALHEQFVFFPLATEEQWNEDIAPKLRDLHLAISGYKKGTPTARQYKYPDRSVWPENLKS